MSTSSEPDVIHEDAWITLWHHPLPNIVHHKVHQPLRGYGAAISYLLTVFVFIISLIELRLLRQQTV